jgi:hypothetical protein
LAKKTWDKIIIRSKIILRAIKINREKYRDSTFNTQIQKKNNLFRVRLMFEAQIIQSSVDTSGMPNRCSLLLKVTLALVALVKFSGSSSDLQSYGEKNC